LVEEFAGGRAENLENVDNEIEFQAFLVSPSCEEKFPFITKDMAITYLTKDDLEKVRLLGYMVNRCRFYGLLRLADRFAGQMNVILVSSRSLLGFERQMEQTKIGKQFQYLDEQTPQKRPFWSKKEAGE
jgi:hypothetical protein